MENHNPSSVSGGGKTPSKQRFRLGVASTYYFKDTPKKTPNQKLIESALRQHEGGGSTKRNKSLFLRDITNNNNKAYSPDSEDDNKTTNNNNLDLSFLSKLDNSDTTTSTTSSDDMDMLNRSALSDTTELTASNFVLLSKSRQKLSDNVLSSFTAAARRKATPSAVSNDEDYDTTHFLLVDTTKLDAIEKEFQDTTRDNSDETNIIIDATKRSIENDNNNDSTQDDPIIAEIVPVDNNNNNENMNPDDTGTFVGSTTRRESIQQDGTTTTTTLSQSIAKLLQQTPDSTTGRNSIQVVGGPPRFGSMSPANLGSILKNMKQQRQQRESLQRDKQRQQILLLSKEKSTVKTKKTIHNNDTTTTTSLSFLESKSFFMNNDGPTGNLDLTEASAWSGVAKNCGIPKPNNDKNNKRLSFAANGPVSGGVNHHNVESDDTVDSTLKFDLFDDLLASSSKSYQRQDTATDDINAYISHIGNNNDDTSTVTYTKILQASSTQPKDTLATKSATKSPKRNSIQMIDSPARHTRSAEKRRLLQVNQRDDSTTDDFTANRSNTNIDDHGDETVSVNAIDLQLSEIRHKELSSTKSAIETSKSSIRLFDSPARNTRSAEKRRMKENQRHDTPTDNFNMDISSPMTGDKGDETMSVDGTSLRLSAILGNVSSGSKSVMKKSASNSIRFLDSPARNTRSTEKKRMPTDSQRRETATGDLDTYISSPVAGRNGDTTTSIDAETLELSVIRRDESFGTSTKSKVDKSKDSIRLFDSPARNTRSVEKKRINDSQRRETATGDLNSYILSPETDEKGDETASIDAEDLQLSATKGKESFGLTLDNSTRSMRLIDSPARNTRSAEKKRIAVDSQRRETATGDFNAYITSPKTDDKRDESLSIDKKTLQSSALRRKQSLNTSTKLVMDESNSSIRLFDSPARNTRSVEKRRIEADSQPQDTTTDDLNNDFSPSSKFEASSTNASNVDLLESRQNESFDTGTKLNIHAKSSVRFLDSPARHTRSAKKRRLREDESPANLSMSFTSQKLDSITEDTQEIATDMDALLKSVANYNPSSAFNNEKSKVSYPPDYSDMSLESTDLSFDNEHTNRLEASMNDLFTSTNKYEGSHTKTPNIKDDRTVQSYSATVELEPNIEELLDFNNTLLSEQSEGNNQHKFHVKRVSRLSLSNDFSHNNTSEILQLGDGDQTDRADDTQYTGYEILEHRANEVLGQVPRANFFKVNETDTLWIIASSVNWSYLSKHMRPLFDQVMKVLEAHSNDDFAESDNLKSPSQIQSNSNYIQTGVPSQKLIDLEKEIVKEISLLQDFLTDIEHCSWIKWLASVIDNVIEEFTKRSEKIISDEYELEKEVLAAEQALDLIACFSNQKACAKRMKNDQILLLALENEVQLMEMNLDRSRLHLQNSLDELSLIEKFGVASSIYDDVLQEHKKEQEIVESAQRSVVSLNTLRRWKPLILNSSSMSFLLLGPCPKACLKVSINVATSRLISIQSCICPEQYRRNSGILHRQVKSVLNFVETRVSAVCSSINLVKLNQANQIGPFLQEIEWQLGRIEEAAVELAMIRRRYKAMLSSNPLSASPRFVLVIGFGNPIKVRATFDVTDISLFSPFNLFLDSMDRTVNMEELEKLLLKTAKPGFGSLARVCGIISAFVK